MEPEIKGDESSPTDDEEDELSSSTDDEEDE